MGQPLLRLVDEENPHVGVFINQTRNDFVGFIGGCIVHDKDFHIPFGSMHGCHQSGQGIPNVVRTVIGAQDYADQRPPGAHPLSLTHFRSSFVILLNR
jgi:hypothetical protein